MVNDIKKTELDELTKIAMELQSLAQGGLTYTKDIYDKERFERIRELSAEIMRLKTGYSIEQVKTLFCNETGYQTPKMDTRAAIFQDDKILLVKEKDEWSMPGGWLDYNETVASNTVKEVKEEAGLDVIPKKIVALQDRNQHNKPIYAYGICKVFVLCEVIGGSFQTNIETTDSGYFGIDELPKLSDDKCTFEQVKMCFDAYRETNWEVIFD